MKKELKSGCSINLGLEVFGDQWTLLIIRDIMLGNKRHFREILKSDEKISTNILTNRLNMLEEKGIIIRKQDESHKQKYIYSLTQKGIDLLPVITAIAEWSLKHELIDEVSSKYTQYLVEGGTKLIKKYMQELKEKHL